MMSERKRDKESCFVLKDAHIMSRCACVRVRARARVMSFAFVCV